MTNPDMTVPGMEIVAVVGPDLSIGRGGDLIRHLPEDLRHFKKLTMGATVVMGRKTWESLPRRPLPGRLNIVVSRNASYSAPGAVVAPSLPEAVELARREAPEARIFVMGGGEIYRQALPMASVMHLTMVHEPCPDADTFFPPFSRDEWTLRESVPGQEGDYEFCRFTRR